MVKEYELQNQILKSQYSDLSMKLTNLTRIADELDKKDRLYQVDKRFSGTASFDKMFSSRTSFKSGKNSEFEKTRDKSFKK